MDKGPVTGTFSSFALYTNPLLQAFQQAKCVIFDGRAISSFCRKKDRDLNFSHIFFLSFEIQSCGKKACTVVHSPSPLVLSFGPASHQTGTMHTLLYTAKSRLVGSGGVGAGEWKGHFPFFSISFVSPQNQVFKKNKKTRLKSPPPPKDCEMAGGGKGRGQRGRFLFFLSLKIENCSYTSCGLFFLPLRAPSTCIFHR